MKRAVLIVALLGVVFLCGHLGANSIWYVSPQGSNANACNGPGAAAACLSVNFVLTNKAACGDVIVARGGNYYLPHTEGSAIVLKVCSSASAETTLVAFNYGAGAVLTPILNSSGGIQQVFVGNGSSACWNGYCGSYSGFVTVGAVCPGLAAANSANLAPTSTPCGDGNFAATATVVGGVITAINVTAPGSGYPWNVKVFAQSGEVPIFSDLLAVYDSTNCSGSNCGFNGSSYNATGCSTSLTSNPGCLIVTNAADNSDPDFPGCATPNCFGWLAPYPSAMAFFDSAFYQQGSGCPTACVFSPIVRRSVGIQPLKNANPQTCDPILCISAVNQSGANLALGCPAGGVSQPGGNFNCAAQVSPAPLGTGTVSTSGTTVTKTGGTNFSNSWSGFAIVINGTSYTISSITNPTTLHLTTSAGTQTNVAYQFGNWLGVYTQFETHQNDLINLHALLIGDMRVQCQEIWTYCYERLIGVSGVSPYLATLSGPASTQDGSNAGFIAGHQYYLKNRPFDVNGGDFYWDRCHNQWTGASSCNSGTPETVPYMFTGANQLSSPVENPQNGIYWIPQMTPPLLSSAGANNTQIIGWEFEGGNYPVPSTGIATTQGQPNVPEMFVLGSKGSTTLQQNLSLEGVIVQHTGGEGFGVHGNVQNFSVKDSAFSDAWGAALRVGDIAQASDVCSGGGQNTPSGFVFQNNLINGVQREDPSGESLGLYIGDVAGWLVDHNDMFRFYIGMVNNGHGLNLGAEAGQLAYCMGNWQFSNNHIEGENSSGNTLSIGADGGAVYGAWNHAPSSPVASLFSDPYPTAANYTGQFFGNVILHAGCDPALSNVDHCLNCLYGDQGAWGANVYNNVMGYCGGEEIEAHLSSHGQGTFGASQFVGQHFWVHNNILYGCGSSMFSSGSVYRRGTIALGWAVIEQNIEVCDTTPNASNPNAFYRQNLFNGFWATYDQSDATITNHGTPSCAGAVSCPSPASATVNGCSGAVVSVSVDSIAGAFSGLIGVKIDTAGTGNCVGATLSWTNCPGCAATLCGSSNGLVSCTPTSVPATTAFKMDKNIVWDPRGNSPLSGVCLIAACNTGSQLYSFENWKASTGEDIGSVNCDPHLVNPAYPVLDFHPTNIGCLNAIGFVMWDYTTAGRSFPVIGANSPPNLYPALSAQLIPDSTYNASYVARPMISINPAGGIGSVTHWK